MMLAQSTAHYCSSCNVDRLCDGGEEADGRWHCDDCVVAATLTIDAQLVRRGLRAAARDDRGARSVLVLEADRTPRRRWAVRA